MLAALASSPATKALDPDPFPRHSLRHAVYAALLHFGFETAQIKISFSMEAFAEIYARMVRGSVDAEMFALAS